MKRTFSALILFGILAANFAGAAELPTLSGLGLLTAEEMASLLPSERQAYLSAIQRAASEAEEVDELEKAEASSRPKKNASTLPRFFKFLFLNDQANAVPERRYCFLAGYVFDDPPCKAPDYYSHGCKPTEIKCNPWLFGDGPGKCTPLNGRETRTCEAQSAPLDQVAAFIQKSPEHIAAWNAYVRLLEKHCVTGRQASICTLLRAKVYGLNNRLGGTLAAAYGRYSPRSSERRAESTQLPVFRRPVSRLAGCDPYTLLGGVSGGPGLEIRPLLSLRDVRALICGAGEAPTASYISGRESVLARAIARASGETRNELETTRANLKACLASAKTNTTYTTLSPSEQTTSPNAGLTVRICTNDGTIYKHFGHSPSTVKLNYRTGAQGRYALPNKPSFHVGNIGAVMSLYQIDICSAIVGDCNDSRLNAPGTQQYYQAPRSQ